MSKSHIKDAGMLSHHLMLQQLIESTDGSGLIEITWQDVGQIWAEIKPHKTSSQFIAQQDIEEASHIIVIRFRHDVASGWRFVKGDRIFNIKWLFDIAERQQYLACYSKEQAR